MEVERKPGAEHEQLTIIYSPSQQMFWSRKATHSLLLVGGGGDRETARCMKRPNNCFEGD